MLSGVFTEIGIGHVDMGWDAGKYSQTQHFGAQFADNLLAGYVYGSGSQYDYANAAAGPVVQIKATDGMLIGQTTADSNRGYVIDLASLGLTHGATYSLMAMSGGSTGSSSDFTYSASSRMASANLTAVPEPSAFLLLAFVFCGVSGRKPITQLVRSWCK